jgi:PhoH-like ATPase
MSQFFMSIKKLVYMGVLVLGFGFFNEVAYANSASSATNWLGCVAKLSKATTRYDGKILVIDTNILINDPTALAKFPGADIYIHVAVMSELDRQKENPLRPDLQFKARRAARFIRELAESNGGSLSGAIPVGEDSRLFFYRDDLKDVIPPGFDPMKADNLIVATALALRNKHQDKEVVFISNDLNPSHLASMYGIKTMDLSQHEATTDELFTGVVEKDITPAEMADFQRDGKIRLSGIQLVPNQFVILNVRGEENKVVDSVAARYEGNENEVEALAPLEQLNLPIHPRNDEQKMALNLLTDPNIKLVTLLGKAGTGKTLLAMAAGLYQTLWSKEAHYESVMITRPTVVLGEEQGFLPGDEKAKVGPYLQPYHDNLDILVKIITDTQWSYEPPLSRSRTRLGSAPRVQLSKAQKRRFEKLAEDQGAIFNSPEFQGRIIEILESEGNVVDPIEPSTGRRSGPKSSEQILNSGGRVEIVNLAYIRGRSVPKRYIIIDEAQNLTAHEIKTIITRAGEGTKIILIGDIGQIDNKALSARTNGLALVVNLFRNEPIAGHMTLVKGERSELAEAATRLFEQHENK